MQAAVDFGLDWHSLVYVVWLRTCIRLERMGRGGLQFWVVICFFLIYNFFKKLKFKMVYYGYDNGLENPSFPFLLLAWEGKS